MTEKKATDKKKGAEPTFEKSLERLETIVSEMESGKLPLETMIARFEEGNKLIGACNSKLNEVERKIEILVKKGEEVTAQPFDETDPPSSEPRRAGGEDLF